MNGNWPTKPTYIISRAVHFSLREERRTMATTTPPMTPAMFRSVKMLWRTKRATRPCAPTISPGLADRLLPAASGDRLQLLTASLPPPPPPPPPPPLPRCLFFTSQFHRSVNFFFFIQLWLFRKDNNTFSFLFFQLTIITNIRSNTQSIK